MSYGRHPAARRTARGRLLVSTAFAACGMALQTSPASADIVPAECSQVVTDTLEIDCVAPAPGTIGQIYTTEDSVFLTVGAPDTPTSVVFDAGDAVIMSGNEQLVLRLYEGSSVTSTSGVGLVMTSGVSSGVYVLGEGDFTGRTDGMRIFHAGNGTLQLNARNVTGVSGTGLAINKYSDSSTAVINISGTVVGAENGVDITDESDASILAAFGNVYGGQDGVTINKSDNGDILMNIAGNVLGVADDGVEINHAGSGDIQVVVQGNLTGQQNAAWIELEGTGDITLANAGTITGDVRIRSFSPTGNITAIVNEVAEDSLIYARALTTGSDTAVTVLATGHVNGNVFAAGFDGDVNVTTQSLTTDIVNVAGIYGISEGTGDIRLIAEGDVLSRRGGLFADNLGGGSITIETQGVTSTESIAIGARQEIGSNGDTYILAHGDLQAGEIGIFSLHDANGDIGITAEGNINAGEQGFRVRHAGDGNIVIDAQGDISALFEGVQVRRGDPEDGPVGEGDVTITTAGTITADRGIAVSHYGSGNISIDAAGAISAETTAISVIEEGVGDISIHAAGPLASISNSAVNVYKIGDGDTAIVADDLVSGFASINVSSFGAGDVNVHAASDLIGSALVAGQGNIAMNFAGSVTGEALIDQAVYAVAPYGSIDIDIGGNVNGSATGVFAQAVDGLVDLAVAGDISATEIGVDVVGASALLDLHNVEGTLAAVRVETSYNLDATIDSAIGGDYGVLANSSGNIKIDIGDAIGTNQSGIEVYAWDSIDVTVRGQVYGADAGIRAYGEDGQAWNFTIAEGAIVKSEGYAFSMNALGTTGQLTLLNNGTIDGASGQGVFLSDSDDGDHFANYGVVTGNIQLGAGDDEVLNGGRIEGALWGNAGQDTFFNGGIFRGVIGDADGMNVVNGEGGVFEVVHALGLDVGGGLVVNAGTFSSGGKGNVYTTPVNGSFVQTETGTMLVDINGETGTADLLDVTGDAELSGTLDVNFVKPSAVTQEFLVVRTGGGDLTNGGLALGANVPLSPLVTLELDFRNTKELYLTSAVDFTPTGANLNPNQEQIAEELNEVFGNGPDALTDLTDALFENVSSLADYPDAINQLVPEVYLNTLQTSLMAAQSFTSEMSGCTARDGVLLSDGKGCAKFSMGGDLYKRDASFEEIGFENGTLKVQGAYFMPLGQTLTLGVGLGYDDTLVRNDIHSRAQGHRLQAGASLTWHDEGLAIGGVLSASRTDYDVERRIFIGNFGSTSAGNQDVTAYTGELSASYTAQMGGLYLKPAASLIATRLHSGAVKEIGGAATDYALKSTNGWHLGAKPSLELGGTVQLDETTIMHPYLRGGVTVLFDDDFAINGAFADAENLGDGFMTTSTIEKTTVDMEAGLQFQLGSRTALSGSYIGRYTDRSESHGFRFRVSFSF